MMIASKDPTMNFGFLSDSQTVYGFLRGAVVTLENRFCSLHIDVLVKYQ